MHIFKLLEDYADIGENDTTPENRGGVFAEIRTDFFFTVWGNPVEKQLVWSWSALELKESTEKCEVRPATKVFLIGEFR